MVKRSRAQVIDEGVAVAGFAGFGGYVDPEAFQVAGPRHVSFPSWRDFLQSKWKDTNYRRTVMACFVQAVYLLELDRQENRTRYTALAPNWWLLFKYRLVKTLIDERDGSIFGALFEWDRASALSDFILTRPRGAPKAVLALRGTLLRGPTFQTDLKDDLRYLTLESLKGSVRFGVALGALNSAVDKYGTKNMCVAGHSLGAGFALQIGKALAKEGIYVEAHLFNPPSFSIPMGLKGVGQKAAIAWKRLKSFARRTRGPRSQEPKKWVPHLYVNDSDYICNHYSDKSSIFPSSEHKDIVATTHGSVSPKMFVLSKENQRFPEAHKLEQWWSDDLELQSVVSHSQLFSQQLKSLYSRSTSPSPNSSRGSSKR